MGRLLSSLDSLLKRLDAAGARHRADGAPRPAVDRDALLRPVTTAYRRRYHQFGGHPKGVFWSSRENVLARFEALARVFDPADAKAGEASVADLGCGYGAFFEFLVAHPAIRGGCYTGYDICEPLLDEAAKRIRDPRASFVLADRATAPADYTFVSGTWNLMLDAPEDQWRDYVFDSLFDLWGQTNKALAFNMLDNRHSWGEPGLYYADPEEFETFCLENLSPDVEIVTDYGVPDFTVFVRRLDAPPQTD